MVGWVMGDGSMSIGRNLGNLCSVYANDGISFAVAQPMMQVITTITNTTIIIIIVIAIVTTIFIYIYQTTYLVTK